IRRSRTIGHGVWVPAFAGTTEDPHHSAALIPSMTLRDPSPRPDVLVMRQPAPSSTVPPSPMSVAAGREFLAIPGPTVIPDAVLAAMHRPAVDIYAGPMVALTDGLLGDLKTIFG